jgi:type II secretory ATPase GspE/PulE/Tfp pilus assembly ATPase PilB-like protein
MSVLERNTAPRIDQETLLNKIVMLIHEATDLRLAVESAYPDIVSLLDAERVTIYQRDRNSDDMVSRYKVTDQLKEIRVSSSTTSMSGYCALTRNIINIPDVYDSAALTKIHPNLVFQDSFDRASGFRTKAMLVVPILFHDALLGVLQVINRRDGGPFDDVDTRMATNLAKVLGQKLRYELQATSGPYAYLVQRGRLTQSDLDEILKRAASTKQTATMLLMREMRISASEIGASMERYYQIPYMPFDPDIIIPKELVQGIKESYLRACGWLPVAGDRKEVTILMDDPSDNAKQREMQRLINAQKYNFRIGLPEDILRFLGQDVATVPESDSAKNTPAGASANTSIGDVADENDAAVVQLVNRLLLASHLDRASDIHIEPAGGTMSTSVRFRVDGSCLLKEKFPAELHRAVISRIKILAKLDISEQRKPQDGKLSVRYKGDPLEFRIATIPTVHGESMVLRLLTGAKLMKIENMNLAPHYHDMLHHVLGQPHGLFLVVGPTGSGKTTSLHALLNHLNTADRKIWTAEDPVEITQSGLQQVQVHPKIGFTFAAAMRSFLRCDPDIIMVGEMRDEETATIGVEASLTGHLVFSTLHSNSAPETLTRLIDLGVEKSSFADALLGVMSQRLMRKLCDQCKQPVQITAELKAELKALYGERFDADCAGFFKQTPTLYKHAGCDACQRSGFYGRMPIHELLIASPDLKRLISQGPRLDQLVEAACDAGMRTLIQDQIIKAFQGYLDVDEVRGQK